MTIKELQKNYKKIIDDLVISNSREETLAYLNRAAKLRSKIYQKSKTNCYKCNGVGFLRISLDEAKTCLTCYGKGFMIKEV